MVPIVYPVLHALIFSYLFIIYVITHAWTSPEKYSRDRESSFFLDITLAHLQYSLSSNLPHPHVHTDAHVYTYTCEKKLASSRDRDLPSEEIDSTIISAALFVDSFSTTMKMGKNRAKRRSRFSDRRYPPPPPRCTHTYLQNHICCVALVSVN